MSYTMGWNWGQHQAISLAAGERLDLGWAFGADNLEITTTREGWIKLTVVGNDQSVTLTGVDSAALSTYVSSNSAAVSAALVDYAGNAPAPAPASAAAAATAGWRRSVRWLVWRHSPGTAATAATHSDQQAVSIIVSSFVVGATKVL